MAHTGAQLSGPGAQLSGSGAQLSGSGAQLSAISAYLHTSYLGAQLSASPKKLVSRVYSYTTVIDSKKHGHLIIIHSVEDTLQEDIMRM